MCEIASADTQHGSATTDVTTAVVSAIAAVEDVDPVDLDFCLADYIDADALNAVVTHGSAHAAGATISFGFRDYDVVVNSPETVVVSRRCDSPDECSTESPRL